MGAGKDSRDLTRPRVWPVSRRTIAWTGLQQGRLTSTTGTAICAVALPSRKPAELAADGAGGFARWQLVLKPSQSTVIEYAPSGKHKLRHTQTDTQVSAVARGPVPRCSTQVLPIPRSGSVHREGLAAAGGLPWYRWPATLDGDHYSRLPRARGWTWILPPRL
jgi:hypothetical protein